MGHVDIGYYIFAAPLALFDTFDMGLVALAAFLGLVGLWLCRSLFSGLCEHR